MVARAIGPWGAAAAAILILAGCAQGPADFLADRLPALPGTADSQPVLSPDDRDELARDLGAAADRNADEGRAAVGGLPSAMALTIIRQQQEEEARELLEGATAEPVPPVCDPAVDPACVPAPQ